MEGLEEKRNTEVVLINLSTVDFLPKEIEIQSIAKRSLVV